MSLINVSEKYPNGLTKDQMIQFIDFWIFDGLKKTRYNTRYEAKKVHVLNLETGKDDVLEWTNKKQSQILKEINELIKSGKKVMGDLFDDDEKSYNKTLKGHRTTPKKHVNNSISNLQNSVRKMF